MIYSKDPSAKLGFESRFGKFCIIEKNVVIGKRVSIGDFTFIGEGAVIDDDCHIGRFCEVRAGCVIGKGTVMGSRCTLSANTLVGSSVIIRYNFVATDKESLSTEMQLAKPCVINDLASFGANVVLLPGVHIGRSAIVGACSQVRHDIPDYEVWYGNPAKFLRKV